MLYNVLHNICCYVMVCDVVAGHVICDTIIGFYNAIMLFKIVFSRFSFTCFIVIVIFF